MTTQPRVGTTNAMRREVEYAVGDLVWKRSYPTTDGTKHFSAKLAKPFGGQFTMSECLGKNVYVLVDDLGVYKGKWHVKDLIPDHTRESEDDRDSDTFIVLILKFS
jgi:hypothetical protein